MKEWRRSKNRAAVLQPNLPGLAVLPARKSRRLATPHDQALEIARNRLTGGLILFSLAYLLIAGRLAYVTLAGAAPEMPLAQVNIAGDAPGRADILDRNGIVLATSLPTISLCADGTKVLNPDEATKQLVATLPGLDPKKVNDDLHSSKHCVMIRRHLTPSQSYAVNKLGIAGLEFRPDERRIYPAGAVTAHVVGYTDIDDNGIAGIEKELDKRLENDPEEPEKLSIDLRLQTIMRQELFAGMKDFNAIGALGLIMDISNGEILALTSLPDFDPQHPGDATDDQRFNRVTLGVYEMGSTFKIFNTALGLDSGLIHIGDAFDTVHPIEIGSQTIRDFEPAKRWFNVAEIFTHSSNIGSAHIADRLGGARQRMFLTQLGLTEKSGVELPEVGSPLAPSVRDWGESTTMTVSFGHGIAVNAVQLAGAVATIVNNGTRVHPTLLLKSADEIGSDSNGRIISPRTSALMRALMRLVVTHGTAKGQDVPGYMLGGKTGTADKIGANHHYLSDARMSSFIGVFPIGKPRYLIFAMLDDPKGDARTHGFATGGYVAAPIVKRVVARIGPLLNMTPLTPAMQEAAEHQTLRPLGAQILDGMPVDEGLNYAAVESDKVQ